MRSAYETAMLLATILNRSGHSRARVSVKTIRKLATRRHLRRAFAGELTDALAEYSWTLTEIDSGGYAALRTKTLEAAKPVTAKRWLSDDEWKALERGTIKLSVFEKEATAGLQQPAAEDEGL